MQCGPIRRTLPFRHSRAPCDGRLVGARLQQVLEQIFEALEQTAEQTAKKVASFVTHCFPPSCPRIVGCFRLEALPGYVYRKLVTIVKSIKKP